MNHEKPKQWSTCHIIPVPKSGNINDVNNYGGILLSTIIFIINRVQPFINCTEKIN